jgi:hypothetical protein
MAAPAESRPQRPDGRPKVLYVMGAGRSGSTILGVTLGNCDGVFFAGELDKWLARGGRTPLPGEERERFWTAVAEQMAADDLFGTATKCLERSSALLRPDTWLRRRRLRVRYREVAEQLYLAVARVAHASHIVDTSHYPLRAHEVQRLRGVDVHLIFAVREPHQVVASFGREDVVERRFGPLAANLYMSLTYAVSAWVFMRHPRERRLLVRHEEFLADPAQAVRQVLRAAGATAATPDLQALHTGLPFQGNRLVRTSNVALRAPSGERPPRLMVTSVLQLPWRLILARLRPAVDVSAPDPLG